MTVVEYKDYITYPIRPHVACLVAAGWLFATDATGIRLRYFEGVGSEVDLFGLLDSAMTGHGVEDFCCQGTCCKVRVS